MKNLIKNRFDFCNDFETTFSRSWVDFGFKNLSKMRGLRLTFSTLLRICEKCDLKQPSHRFAIFFDFRPLLRMLVQIGDQMDAQINKKYENLSF